MLVLTRKPGQKLIIANDIEITILEIRGESVKIGIQAPKNIPVYREEVYDEIRKANQQAKEQAKNSQLDIAALTKAAQAASNYVKTDDKPSGLHKVQIATNPIPVQKPESSRTEP